MGIGGKFLGWVESFLKGRSFQVRINNVFSQCTLLQNGTAQGAQISPLLFIVMNSDLSKELERVEPSLFADDLAISKGGRNVSLLVKEIQRNLEIVQEWCDNWGMKISIEKSVAVLFTNSSKNHDIKLKLYGKDIPIKSSAKFLGVTFDSKLNFRTNITNIVDRCNRKINILRSLTGTSWGASPDYLRILYISLILSVIDYGSIIYYVAPLSVLQSLDHVQYICLKIITGAIKGTAVTSLQVATGQPPLNLRRLEIQKKIFFDYNSKPHTSL